jgi:hypothetical protein
VNNLRQRVVYVVLLDLAYSPLIAEEINRFRRLGAENRHFVERMEPVGNMVEQGGKAKECAIRMNA